jgi:hypothetical protein
MLRLALSWTRWRRRRAEKRVRLEQQLRAEHLLLEQILLHPELPEQERREQVALEVLTQQPEQPEDLVTPATQGLLAMALEELEQQEELEPMPDPATEIARQLGLPRPRTSSPDWEN